MRVPYNVKVSDEKIEDFKEPIDEKLFEEIIEKERYVMDFETTRLKAKNFNLKQFNIYKQFDPVKQEIKLNPNKRKGKALSRERQPKRKRLNVLPTSTKQPDDETDFMARIKHDIINSKLELHKCENKFCPKMILPPATDAEIAEDCAICLGSLEGKEMALLSNCDHAHCTDCISRWRDDKWVYHCPMCRQHSHSTVFSRRRFKGRNRQKMFDNHVDCYKHDPNMVYFLHRLNPEWLALAKFLLRGVGDNIPYLLKWHADKIDADIISWGAKYASFRVRRNNLSEIIIYSTYEGITFQLMLSNKNILHEDVDNQYADQVAGWLNRQLASSVKVMPNLLNPLHDSYVIWRKFDHIHCVLLVQKMANSTPVDNEKAVMKDQLMNLLPHNFKNQNVRDEVADDDDEYCDDDVEETISTTESDYEIFHQGTGLKPEDSQGHDHGDNSSLDYFDQDDDDDDWDMERIDPKVQRIVRKFFLVADVKQKLEMVDASDLLIY